MLCNTRRRFLSLLPAGPLALSAQSNSRAEVTGLGIPGPYRGRVVSVAHQGAISNGVYQREPVREMVRRGMRELTGSDGWLDAWRKFFSSSDVVGIKLNPVGLPHIISSPEVVGEIISSLRAVGLKPENIVVYDRYRRQFLGAGFDKWLPQGVRWSFAAEDYDNVQHAIEGYDSDHYLDMALVQPGDDPKSLTARRSYVCKFLTTQVNKLINLCVLKDHQSAGVTLALKNLSHGHVNNVSRSHSSSSLNACGAFIPAVVSLPVIRNKTVLNILDGVQGQYHGGPSGKPQFIWEHKTMYFATDPVAMDHVGWRVIDEKRVAMGKKPLVEDTPDKFSTFVHRQPEHVEIAGALGLGEWQWEKIDRREIRLT